MKKILLSLVALCCSMAIHAEVTEVLTVDSFNITKATVYQDVKYTSEVTGITYAGNMCKANDANGGGMQFRTTGGKEAGLVATANPQGYVIKSVTVTPSTEASTTNQWDVYGNASAYATFKDLYNASSAGSLLGSGTVANTVAVSAEGLGFFGFRGNKNAIYISEIKIVYDVAAKDAASLNFSEAEVTVKYGDEFTAPVLTKETTAPAVFSSSNEDVATVDEETGNVTILAPGSTVITATTAETEDYFAGSASYTINVVKAVKSIAEAMQITDKNLQFIVDFPLTVAFKNFNNTFATDGTDFIQVYGSGQPDYVAGDVIPAGWIATYSFYNNVTPELMYKSGLQAATEHVDFVPAAVSEVTVEDVNKVVTIKNVTFAEPTPSTKDNFTGVCNGTDYTFRNNYTVEGVDAGTYDVTVVVNVYNGAMQLYVIGYGVDNSGSESTVAATFDFVANTYNLGVRNGAFIADNAVATTGGVTLQFSKTMGNGFRLWNDGLRIYNAGDGYAQIAISAGDAVVTKIEMATLNTLSYARVDDQDMAMADNVYTWTGNEVDPKIVLHPGTKAVAITSLVVTYLSDTPVKDAAGLSFSETEVTVKYGDEFTAPVLTKETTAPAVFSSSNEDVATVDEETGNVTILAPGTVVITATTAETEDYYAGRASYTINVMKAVKSIAEAMEITDTKLEFVVDFPLTVAFKNGNNTFATDGTDFIQVYGSGQPAYTTGDVIPAGWRSTYSFYNGTTPELMYKSGLQAAVEQVEFTPEVVTEITVEDVNNVLTLKSVTFDEATPSAKENFTGKVGDTEYSFRNNYTIAGVDAGIYNVTCVVTVYNNLPSLYVISYEKVPSGIAGVEADNASAPVEYYNLQGVRVANPENGLFIRRQGDKFEKVVIR